MQPKEEREEQEKPRSPKMSQGERFPYSVRVYAVRKRGRGAPFRLKAERRCTDLQEAVQVYHAFCTEYSTNDAFVNIINNKTKKLVSHKAEAKKGTEA